MCSPPRYRAKRDTIEPCGAPGLAVAGRLDADSSGLLIFSQHGPLKRAIIGGELLLEKEYVVRVSGYERMGPATLRSCVEQLRHGIYLDDRPLLPAEADWVDEGVLCMTLKQGRFRQIRRMCEEVGLKVEHLRRVRIGGLRLDGLRSAQVRAPKGKYTAQDV